MNLFGQLHEMTFGVLAALAGLMAPSQQTVSAPELAPLPEMTIVEQADEATVAAPVCNNTPLAQSRSRFLGWGVAYLPRGLCADERGYDVVMHFHGSPDVMQRAWDRAQMKAVLVVVNLGIGSSPYEQRFSHISQYRGIIEQTSQFVSDATGIADAHPKRLALSAWSAGYGAVVKLLSTAGVVEQVDAVLLADGMHAGYVDTGVRRRIDDHRMRPLLRYAERAAKGETLMAITHTSIRTSGYASTTETAHYLAERLEVAANPNASPEPLGNAQGDRLERAGFRIDGYPGGDAQAHIDHFVNIDRTLLSSLEARWSR